MPRTTIMNKIQNSERYQAVLSVYAVLAEKYGSKITVAGGCLVDSYHDKSFYDIDTFISYKDLKDEWKNKVKHKSRRNSHILEVFRDTVDGFDIDIVVIDYSVAKHIRRFDQVFKQLWLDQKGLHMTKQAARDIDAGKITIGTLNGPAIYFRVLRSARKYNMVVDDVDFFLMENFMSSLDKFILPKKYQHMKKEFMPYKNPDELLGRVVYKYSTLYWNVSAMYIPSWTMLKRFVKPYLMRIDWRHIR